MTSSLPLRQVSDDDIDDYAAYRAKIAAISGPDDPSPRRFSQWFESRYSARPIEILVHDASSAPR